MTSKLTFIRLDGCACQSLLLNALHSHAVCVSIFFQTAIMLRQKKDKLWCNKCLTIGLETWALILFLPINICMPLDKSPNQVSHL